MLLLAGTPYWPSLDGCILVVEEDEAEKPQTIDRYFTQLRHMGVFDRIAGLAVGRMPRSVGLGGDSSLDAILGRALAGYDFPVLVDIDYGHTDPLLTLPSGVSMELNADDQTIQILEAAVL